MTKNTTKKYWSLIESPSRNSPPGWMKRDGCCASTCAPPAPPRSIRKPKTIPANWPMAAPGDAICQWQAPGIRARAGGRRAGVRQEGVGGAAGYSLRHHHGYGAVAKRIGRPTAARAVGAANGANPIALIVPCHRVIGGDGSLTGYGGGFRSSASCLSMKPASLVPGSICSVSYNALESPRRSRAARRIAARRRRCRCRRGSGSPRRRR